MSFKYPFSIKKSVNTVIPLLKKYGIVHIPNYLTKKNIKILNVEFEKSLDGNWKSVYAQSAHPTNTNGRAARFNPWQKNAKDEFPKMTSVYQDPFMKEVADAYYSPYKYSFNEAVFITHELPCDIPILPWHYDRVQALKFWFNLSDTTKKDGAFEYCPGTHWEGHFRAGYYLSQGVSIEELPNDIDPDLILNPVTIELKAGDLLIFDPDGFHRGGIVEKGGERRVLRGHTYPQGRRYGDKLFSPGWWLKTPLNMNRIVKNATSRVIGENISDKSVNRYHHDISK